MKPLVRFPASLPTNKSHSGSVIFSVRLHAMAPYYTLTACDKFTIALVTGLFIDLGQTDSYNAIYDKNTTEFTKHRGSIYVQFPP